MKAPYITKGVKVHVEFFSSKELGTYSLSGFQPKVTGLFVSVAGPCVHFRGDHPTHPTQVKIFIDVTEGELPEGVELVKPFGCTHEKGHLEIREEWIKAIEKDGVVYKTKPNR